MDQSGEQLTRETDFDKLVTLIENEAGGGKIVLSEELKKQIQDEGLDTTSFCLLDDKDLKELGFSMGPRKILLKFIAGKLSSDSVYMQPTASSLVSPREVLFSDSTSTTSSQASSADVSSCTMSASSSLCDRNSRTVEQDGIVYPIVEILSRYEKGAVKGSDVIKKLRDGVIYDRSERIFVVKTLGKYLMAKCATPNAPTRSEKEQMAKSLIKAFPILSTNDGVGYERFYDGVSHTGFLEHYIRQRRSRCVDIQARWNHVRIVQPQVSNATSEEDERKLKERRPNGQNRAELLGLLDSTRSARRQWITERSPSITEILDRYPRFFDMQGAMEHEFRGMKPDALTLRNEWYQFRDRILTMASTTTNDTELSDLLQSIASVSDDDRTVLSYKVLPYLLRTPPTRGTKKPRTSASVVCDKFYFAFENDELCIDEAVQRLKQAGCLQPVLFKLSDQYFIKVDNGAIRIETSCFDDAIESLLFTFYVFNVAYANELKLVYGFLERVMKVRPYTTPRSTTIDDFFERLNTV